MDSTRLFLANDGSWVTSSSMVEALDRLGVASCRILYLHTGMTFGVPNPALSRREILACLHQIISDLGIPTLCLPAFTFSFCNGEPYHAQQSRSRMGALNEYLRALPGTRRSIDPLMSTLLIGEETDLVCELGKHSIGKGSTFDKLHLRGKDVGFAFLGTTASDCFTYTHYVEEQLGVPYRYRRAFTGQITDGAQTWEDTYELFVRYRGVVPATDKKLEMALAARGHLRKISCGDSSISWVDEPSSFAMICEHILENPLAYILEDPGDRDTTFLAHKMVAL